MPIDDVIDDFFEAAIRFIDWANSTSKAPIVEAGIARNLLANLFASAVRLPKTDECQAIELMAETERRRLLQRFREARFGFYSDVLNPMAVPPEAAGIGDLADDLADVYQDVSGTLALRNAGDREAAIRHARFWFDKHWGKHAVDAMRVLHCFMENEP